MSNGTAIATCTAVLRRLFQDALTAAALGPSLGGNPTVTALAPDRITVGGGEQPQLNLFLYRLTPNTGWCNSELPSHAADGHRLTRAPLALDLHYVVSAYGSDSMHADVLLGHAALVMHTARHLTRERVRALLAAVDIQPVALRTLLTGSGLDEQEEVIRLAPDNLGIDDISKLWSVFGERYRTSLAFTASVVLLRPDVPALQAKPVREPNLLVVPIPLARIERIEPPSVVVGDMIRITGFGLLTANTVVRIGTGAGLAAPPGSTPQRMDVTVPSDLQAGFSGVQVIHSVDFGGPNGTRRVADSNVASLTIRPAFALDGGGQPDITAAGVATANGVLTAGTLQTRLIPDVERNQKSRLLLNSVGVVPALAYALTGRSRALDSQVTAAVIDFDVAGVRAGTYTVSVEIDGVATSLTTDANGTFDGPTVVL